MEQTRETGQTDGMNDIGAEQTALAAAATKVPPANRSNLD